MDFSCQIKYGIYIYESDACFKMCNSYNEFVFGISVKSEEIAKEMLEIFKEDIEKYYGK